MDLLTRPAQVTRPSTPRMRATWRNVSRNVNNLARTPLRIAALLLHLLAEGDSCVEHIEQKCEQLRFLEDNCTGVEYNHKSHRRISCASRPVHGSHGISSFSRVLGPELMSFLSCPAMELASRSQKENSYSSACGEV